MVLVTAAAGCTDRNRNLCRAQLRSHGTRNETPVLREQSRSLPRFTRDMRVFRGLHIAIIPGERSKGLCGWASVEV
jgi:hypothetical protein